MKNTNLTARANAYRLPQTTTPENLEMHFSTVLTYGDRVLVSWYFYSPDHKNHAAAIYRFTTDDHSIEGEVELIEVAAEQFSDNGHAIAWAIAH